MRFIKAEPGPKNTVIYHTDDGKKFEYSGGNWAWRNHNPGNLVPGVVSKRNGQIGKAGGFAIFPDYESGHSALLDSLKNTYGNNSLGQMIKNYAPSNENDTKNYLKFLQNKTGVVDDKKIKNFSPEEFEKLWKAIMQMEGQKEGTIKELPSKGKITRVTKDKKGIIVSYFISGMGWVSKGQAIVLCQNGKIDAVVACSSAGNLFLKSRPDGSSDNNFSNMG